MSPTIPPANWATNDVVAIIGITAEAAAKSKPTPLSSLRCKNKCADIAPVERLTSICVIAIDQNARVCNASLGVKSCILDRLMRLRRSG